jgi:Mg-chelatase subunit ChlD
MQPKKQLITLGQDGELALKAPNGTIQKMPDYSLQTNQSFVYLVIDCSGSMAGNKLAKAKKGSLDFATTAFSDGYSVGLISFSDSASHLSSPTNNIKQLTLGVNNLHVSGGTNMTPAIEEVISQFRQKTNALRAMVIITDGLTINPQSALKSAEKAKQLGISILTIGTDDADFKFLSQLASDSNLAKKVSSTYLEVAISDVARMLPRG